VITSSRWLYKIKHVANGNIKNFKLRFMVRGFSEKEGVDYKETFSPVTRYAYIRDVISIAIFMRWRIHDMDVKTNLSNGIVEEKVYIEKHRGFEVHGRESHECRLKKSLYRLKQ
jgi:hypothetical protein